MNTQVFPYFCCWILVFSVGGEEFNDTGEGGLTCSSWCPKNFQSIQQIRSPQLKKQIPLQYFVSCLVGKILLCCWFWIWWILKSLNVARPLTLPSVHFVYLKEKKKIFSCNYRKMWLFMKGYLHPGVLKGFVINNNKITVSSNSEDFILIPRSIEI